MRIMVLMLKKMGLDEKAYTIDVLDGVTVNRVVIPLKLELKKEAVPFTKAIVEYINEIPQFPENIMQIQRAINDPESKMQKIAQLISSDIVSPGVAARTFPNHPTIGRMSFVEFSSARISLTLAIASS